VRAFRSTETVKCGDQDLTLAIDIEIIDALEDEFDCGFDQIFATTIGKGRVGKTTRLLRGLLQRHHPDLSLDDVGGLAVEYGIELGEAITRLIEKAIPEAESGPEPGPEAKDENPPTAHRGTGASSSSRGARQISRQSSSGSRRREPCS
jgi:hypothetical protein